MLTHKLPTFATTRLATSALKGSNSKPNAGNGSRHKRSKPHEFLSRLLKALGGDLLVEMDEEVYPALLPAFQQEIVEQQDPHLLVESILGCLLDFDHFDSVRANMVQFQRLIGVTEEIGNNRRLFSRYKAKWETHGIESLEEMLMCDISVVGELLSEHPQDEELSLLFEQVARSL